MTAKFDIFTSATGLLRRVIFLSTTLSPISNWCLARLNLTGLCSLVIHHGSVHTEAAFIDGARLADTQGMKGRVKVILTTVFFSGVVCLLTTAV